MDCADKIAIISVAVDCFGILVAALVAVWVVYSIQKRIDNQRSIKDHLVNETVEIRRLYREIIEKITNGECRPKDVKRQLRLLSARVTDLISLANIQFKKSVGKDFLLAYQLDLNVLITDDENFENAFMHNDLFSLAPDSQRELVRFSIEKDHLFNELIAAVNKAR